MILITKTYQIITEESAENGEFAESGFIFESVEYSFREIVDLLKDNGGTMSSYPSKGSIYDWLCGNPDIDYITGNQEMTSIHYSYNNPSRNAKYWTKALRAAGFIN